MAHVKTSTPNSPRFSLYHVLCANENPRARDVLSAAHNLLRERAAKIDDEELRRSFLENVAAHREIVKEWGNGQIANRKSQVANRERGGEEMDG